MVLGSKDLEATAERFWDRYGLASVEGGRHDAWGTANRIVPLGDDYIEFLAVVEHSVAVASPFGRFLAGLTADGDRWFTVCIADDDIEATVARLGLELTAGARRRPDGQEVRWRGAGLEDSKREPWLPFFIEWQVPPEGYPGRMSAKHGVDVTGIARVEMAGDPHRLAEWLGCTLPSILVSPGADPGVRAVALTVADGELVL